MVSRARESRWIWRFADSPIGGVQIGKTANHPISKSPLRLSATVFHNFFPARRRAIDAAERCESAQTDEKQPAGG